jgi:hypothetical protein
MSRSALLLIAGSAVALLATVLGGERHDYPAYLEQWRLVLAGLDPWSGDNAYGPLHNAFAPLLIIHPLVPKIVTAASLCIANGLLVFALERQRPWRDWRLVYLLAFGANILPWVSVFWFGNNDGVVAALVIGAVLARRDGRMLLCGLLLGLATLDKYYPALLIPFFALDERKVETRLILSALVTTAVGMITGILIWGRAFFEAVAFGISRDATILSIFHTFSVVGHAAGYGDAADALVRLNSLLVLGVWIGAVGLAWVRRDNWLVASTWGFLAMLVTYKVGHQQFYVTWCALVACLLLVNSPAAERLARLSLPYATFLSIFQLGFIALQPVYYRGPWVFIPNYIGVVSLGLALVQLWLFLRSPQRQSRASRNPDQTMGHSEVQPGLPLSRE